MNTDYKLNPPRRRLEWLKYLISALILFAGVASFFGLMYLRQPTAKMETDALLPLVELAPVARFEGSLDLLVSGTVIPHREIKVGAEVPGRIMFKAANCQTGSFVRKGTRLMEIDPRNFELEINTLDAELLQADKTMDETEEEIRGAAKSLEIARSDYQLQQTEFRRFENLKRSVSATEMDQARRNLLNSEAQLTLRQNSCDMLLARRIRLQATKILIESRKEKALLELERTIIEAPEDGVIVRLFVEQGDFVTVAQQLFVLEDTSRAEVICNLTPGELAWLRRYAPADLIPANTANSSSVYKLPRLGVEIFEQADAGVKWSGILERFDGIGRNETTKSIPVRIGVAEPVVPTLDGRRALVRGMYVKCRLVISEFQNGSELVAFPEKGLRPGDYVWVVREERLKRIDVRVIDRSPVRETMSMEKMVVVELAQSDLQIGDQVVVSPLPQPVDGGRVLLPEGPAGVTSTLQMPAIETDRPESGRQTPRVPTSVPAQTTTSSLRDRS